MHAVALPVALRAAVHHSCVHANCKECQVFFLPTATGTVFLGLHLTLVSHTCMLLQQNDLVSLQHHLDGAV